MLFYNKIIIIFIFIFVFVFVFGGIVVFVGLFVLGRGIIIGVIMVINNNNNNHYLQLLLLLFELFIILINYYYYYYYWKVIGRCDYGLYKEFVKRSFFVCVFLCFFVFFCGGVKELE